MILRRSPPSLLSTIPIARALYVAEIIGRCQALAEQPLRYPVIADFGLRLRRFPYRGYSIYYEISQSRDVIVVHILNDALDHRRVFRPD